MLSISIGPLRSISLPVRNLEASAAFYKAVFDHDGRMSKGDEDQHVNMIAFDNHMLKLQKFPEATTAGNFISAKLVVFVPHIIALVARLVANGITPRQGGLRFINVRDPDGHSWNVHQFPDGPYRESEWATCEWMIFCYVGDRALKDVARRAQPLGTAHLSP